MTSEELEICQEYREAIAEHRMAHERANWTGEYKSSENARNKASIRLRVAAFKFCELVPMRVSDKRWGR